MSRRFLNCWQQRTAVCVISLTTALLSETTFAAADEPSGQLPASVAAVQLSDPSYLLQVLLSLIVVVGTIFLLSFLLRKFELTPGSKEGPIKIVHSVGIGGKEQLLLVQVGEEQILLGRSPGQISAVHQLKEPVQMAESAGPNQVAAGVFSKILNREM